MDGRSCKPKKGKAKAINYESTVPSGSKRKRGIKSLSVTPEGDDEEEDHNMASLNYQFDFKHAEYLLIIEAT